MKFSTIKKSFLGFSMSLVLVTACTSDFEEINKNPNGPVEVPSYLLLPSIAEATADQLYSTFLGGDMGSCWIQHWAKVQYNEEERYNPRVTSINNWWNLLYARSLQDVKTMHDRAIAEDNQKVRGIALIWHSYIFSLLTDSYGDIPYSQALRAGEGITNPAYDEQSAIYPALIDSLESAVTYLAGNGSVPAVNDIVYGGDVTKWAKFANSLRFRLLMRMSGKANVAAELQAIVNEGNVFSSNADNAQLNYLGQNPNANPIWNTVIFTTRLEWRINETLVTAMTNLSDPRLSVYAQPNNAGIIRGCAPGILNPTVEGYDYANTSLFGEYFLQPSTPAVFMDYAQLNFLMAEAAVKGYISGGNTAAANYYNAGVAASFDTYNGFVNEDGSVVNMSAGVYLAGADVAFDPTRALEQIGTQSWIALYGQGVEAWTEWRRTGFPALSPAIDPINITTIPTRYTYPADEQNLNGANYSAAAAKMGSDELTTKVWWMD